MSEKVIKEKTFTADVENAPSEKLDEKAVLIKVQK